MLLKDVTMIFSTNFSYSTPPAIHHCSIQSHMQKKSPTHCYCLPP